MAKLTKEVIERVAAELQSRCFFKEIETSFSVAEAIIPLAQLPWDEPSVEEFRPCWEYAKHISLYANRISLIDEAMESALCEFVRRRNAALQPKPDPRIAKLVVILDTPWVTQEDRAVNILAALDEVK